MPTHPVATTLLPVKQVHPNPDQPRKNFDPDALLDLRTSILERGLINPISVMEITLPSPIVGEGGGEGPHYLIMAGERRFRACSDLGWKEIDARIWPSTTPPEEVELLSLVENVQRNDLKPIEEARAYKILNEAPYQMSQEAIAQKVGKRRTRIAEMLGLLEQPVEIQDFVSQETISVTHLRYIGRIEDRNERIKWAKRAGDEAWNVKETEKRVTQYLAGQPKGKGEGAKPIAKPSWKTSETPQFTLKGGRVLVQTSFVLGKDNPKAFLDGLMAPLAAFVEKGGRVVPAEPAVPAAPPKRQIGPEVQAAIDEELAKQGFL